MVTEENVLVLKRNASKYLGVNTKNSVRKLLSNGSENKVLNIAVCIHIYMYLHTCINQEQNESKCDKMFWGDFG